jgi:hypothetical protein
MEMGSDQSNISQQWCWNHYDRIQVHFTLDRVVMVHVNRLECKVGFAPWIVCYKVDVGLTSCFSDGWVSSPGVKSCFANREVKGGAQGHDFGGCNPRLVLDRFQSHALGQICMYQTQGFGIVFTRHAGFHAGEQVLWGTDAPIDGPVFVGFGVPTAKCKDGCRFGFVHDGKWCICSVDPSGVAEESGMMLGLRVIFPIDPEPLWFKTPLENNTAMGGLAVSWLANNNGTVLLVN